MVPRARWNYTKLKINLHCRKSLVAKIKQYLTVSDVSQQDDALAKWESGPFSRISRMDFSGNFPSKVMHALLLRQINEESARRGELWFGFGDTKAKMTLQDFCLVTGLKNGELNRIVFLADKDLPKLTSPSASLTERYFANKPKITMKMLVEKLNECKKAKKFEQDDDALKLCYVLFAHNVLFGQDYRRDVNRWLWNLVERLPEWNEFQWGNYVWTYTYQYLRLGFRITASRKKGQPPPPPPEVQPPKIAYHLYGFPWGVIVSFLFPD